MYGAFVVFAYKKLRSDIAVVMPAVDLGANLG